MTRTQTSPPPVRHRIFVADDHGLVRAGIRRVLALDDSLEVVGEAGSAAEVLAWLARSVPDLALLDLSMPGCTGIDLVTRVVAAHPAVPILVITMSADDGLARSLLDEGARGFISKDCGPRQLLEAVRHVLAGKIHVDPRIDRAVAEPARAALAGQPVPRLSARERQVLAELAHGKPLIDIGAEMKLASSTVSTYKTRLMEKLGQPSLSALVRYAVRHGLVD
ncbi:MAG: response regulator [Burkholderiaceae bacterium]|jgi:two-component system invasion response regulator UvrY